MMYDSNDPTSVIPPTLINSYSVLTIPAYLRAMRFLSENLSSFPRRIHRGKIPLDVPHPLDAILGMTPNAYQDGSTFWRTFFFHAAHTANGFARIERDAAMRPIAIHNVVDLMPFRIITEAGQVQQWYAADKKTVIPGADVIHLVGLSADGMAGADPIQLNADTFQRAKTIDKYQTRFLMKGTVLRGAVQVPGHMETAQIQEFRQILRSNFRGAEAEDDVIILTDGATLNNATMTPLDSQLIEQAAYTTKQIGQITGVHPYYLFDDKDGKYNNNTEQAGIDVQKYLFRLWGEAIECQLSVKLLTSSELAQGLAIRLDTSVITRGDSKTITETTVAQTNAGLRTPNEGREALGLPNHDDPASDVLRVLGSNVPAAAPGGKMSAARDAEEFTQLSELAVYGIDLLFGGPGSGPQGGGGDRLAPSKSDSPKVAAMKAKIAAMDVKAKEHDAKIADHAKEIEATKAKSAELDKQISETHAAAAHKEAENAVAHADLHKTIADLKSQISATHEKIAAVVARTKKMEEGMKQDEKHTATDVGREKFGGPGI